MFKPLQAAILLASLPLLVNAQSPIPPAPGEVRVAVPAEGVELSAWLRAGTNPAGVAVTLSWSDGSNTLLRFQAASTRTTRPVPGGKKNATEPVVLSNACVEMSPSRLKFHVRPNPDGYPADTRNALIAKWDTYPPASERLFPFSVRPDGQGAQLWLDGRYAGRIDKAALLTGAVFRAAADAEVRDAGVRPWSGAGRYLRLDMARLARPGAMKEAACSLPPGEATLSGVPLLVGQGSDNADVGLAKELTGGGMENDPYLSRTAFDAMPESLLFAVPLAPYIRAWMLCAVEDNPAKDPVLTARLTRFANGGRGDAIADTTVWLPRDTNGAPPGVTRAGTVTLTVKGKPVERPLWLVEVPLKAGEIQDLVHFSKNESYTEGRLPDRRYLDFEFLGKLVKPFQQGEVKHKPDPASISGVHVFGVTLERSPVEMEVRQVQVGNVFQGAEKAEVTVALRPREAGSYRLKWAVRNVDGQAVGAETKRLKLKPADGEQVVTVPLAQRESGWYGLDLALEDEAGRPLIEHRASFAILPPDTRRAGYESPYGTWWFGTAHRGTDNREVGGPLMAKAGLRHTNFGWHKLNEADMAPWKVTAFQIPWLFRVGTGSVAEASAKYEQAVRDYLVRFPHCREADIFHESYSGDTIPAELRDGKPAAMTPEKAEAASNRMVAATAATKVLREKFPHIKTVFANSNPGASLVAEFFRAGYPADYIDYLGIEAAGQTFSPEKITEYGTQAGWVIRETARKMGHELPVTCCYEWIYRQERVLGAQRLAEWITRDALVARAYRFTNISIALLYDAGNCYFNSLWGGSGLFTRYPMLYPKPAYVAYATLTRVLDDVNLVRRVPTGSATLYALEFERDGARIYALWTPRGVCRTTLRFGQTETVTVTDLYGRSRTERAKKDGLSLEVGTAVQYVQAPRPATVIEAGARTYPQDPPPAGFTVANAMDKASEWTLAPGQDDRLECPTNGNLPLRTAGTYTLREADDPEKGKCLEVELVPAGAQPDIMNEYAVLALNPAAPVPGEPTTLGVWVKGNSGWGRVMWQFEDAEGKRFLSCGTPGWGCDILDWPGDISVNYDGWCFLRFPLSAESPVKSVTPGGVAGQWVITGGTGKKVAYPIKLTGLAVEMTRKALDLTEMAPVRPVLRFRDLGAY